jgi:hypothetical protein
LVLFGGLIVSRLFTALIVLILLTVVIMLDIVCWFNYVGIFGGFYFPVTQMTKSK